MTNNDNTTAAFVRDITADQFESAVIQASHQAPVIVDFWAPWCGPCKQLGPMLEKVVGATQGAVQMVKVNIDEEQALAGAIGVQSIPTVFAFYQGQPIDGFGGIRAESDVKKFVNNLLKVSGTAEMEGPEEVEIEAWLTAANKAFAKDDVAKAMKLYARVLQVEPETLPACIGFLRSLIRLGDYEQARKYADSLPDSLKSDSKVSSALTALELAESASDVTDGEVKKLRKKTEKKKKELPAHYDLARILFVRNEAEEAIDLLLAIIECDKDWEEQKARTQLLEFFAVLGENHPLTQNGRRKLSSVLFA